MEFGRPTKYGFSTSASTEYKHVNNEYLDDSLGSNKIFNLSLHLSFECIKTTNMNNLFEKT